MPTVIYGGIVIWLSGGAFLGLRGRVGVLWMVSAAIFALLLAMMLKGDASAGAGDLPTALSFTLMFLWLPALWIGFVFCAVAQWLFALLRGLKTRK